MAIEQAAPVTESDKDAAVNAAIKDIEKNIGKGSLMKMGDAVGQKMPCVPTGIIALDSTVLGIGGLPRGRIVEMFGPESGGKTSVALTTAATTQQKKGRVAFIDAEHALDPNWAALLGVKVDDLLISQPDTAEQALQIVERLVESQAIDLIIIDSVAALTPRAELEGEIGDSVMGLQARLMGQAMRKLAGAANKAQTSLLFINQVREKLGVVYGDPTVTPGGRALKFYASVRLDVRRKEVIKEGDAVVGNRIKITAKKNKCAAPFKECEVELFFASGFDNVGPVLDVAAGLGVVEKAGSWYSYKRERLGQGRSQAIASITERNLFDILRKEVEAKRG